MLLRFSFQNHRSFRDETTIHFVIPSATTREAGVIEVEAAGGRVLTVLGLFGANASGKSAALDALRWMQSSVRSSHRRWPLSGPIPRRPFRLDAASGSRPSAFELDFLLDGTRMRYRFAVDDTRVTEEALYTWPSGRRTLWFERDKDGFRFGRTLHGRNQTIKDLTRPNALFLSVAAENNHERLTPVYRWLTEGLRALSPDDEGARYAFTGEMIRTGARRREVVELVRRADLGLADLEVKESVERLSDEEVRKKRAILEAAGIEEDEISSLLPREQLVATVLFHHEADSGQAAPAPLHTDDESRGTLAWFALAGPILDALEHGHVLLCDELDASLHPLLVAEIIALFSDPRRNPRGAQLVFNSHDLTMLGHVLDPRSTLRREAVWLVEKGRDGASRLYPLSDFSPRKGENLERGYLQGRYGAVPYLGGLTSYSLVMEDDRGAE